MYVHVFGKASSLSDTVDSSEIPKNHLGFIFNAK